MMRISELTKALVAGFVGIASFSLPALAQTDYAAIEADPALWSVSDEDSTVYLFGTIHILPPELDWLNDDIKAALDDADVIYLEADALSPEAQARMQALIPQLGLNEPGVTLSSLISDEAKANVATLAGTIGAPPELLMAQLDPFKPWLASVSLAVVYIQAQGYSPNSGAEFQISALYPNTDRAYLETVEEQFGYLSGHPLDIQVRDFEIGIKQMVEEPEMLTEMVQSWAAGDMTMIDQIFNEDMREQSPEMYQSLIVTRNQNWIEPIKAALDGDQDAFIAVGAGHMPGDVGVIKLLQDEGLDVTRHN